MTSVIDKAKFEKRAKLAMRLGMLIISPLIVFLAANAILAGLMIAAIAVGNAMVPAFTMKLSQWKFRALEKVIDDDPIAAAWAVYYKEGDELKKVYALIESQMADVETYRLDLQSFREKYGVEPKPHQVERLSQMEAITAFRLATYNEAARVHAEDGRTLKIDESSYKLDQASIKIGQSLNMQDDWKDKFTKDRIESSLTRRRAESMASIRMAIATNGLENAVKNGVEVVAPSLKYDDHGRICTKLIEVVDVKSSVVAQPVHAQRVSV